VPQTPQQLRRSHLRGGAMREALGMVQKLGNAVLWLRQIRPPER